MRRGTGRATGDPALARRRRPPFVLPGCRGHWSCGPFGASPGANTRQEAITRAGAPCEPIDRPSGCDDPGVIRLAVGPARDYPSWNWVGADTARELAKYADVALFESFRRIPPSDAIMIVKHRPPLALARAWRGRGIKLVYVPVDIYASRSDIHRDRLMLEVLDLVLAHDELLLECLRPYCTRVGLVEHHGKYTLADMAPYKPDGYVLW